MDKIYNPQAIEQKWYNCWEENNYFAPSQQGTPYCIMIPPPNVTGILHMGHGFQNSIIDALIRYHRMRQDNTLWQVGTDHAGIATQMVVERQLMQQNISRHSLGREEFVKRVWEWKHKSGGAITQQLRRLGVSVDWSTERFTLDEGLSNAVQKSFIQLHKEGLIYRGQRLVNWDPILGTAVSDLEVVSEEEQSFLWHIRYPLSEANVNGADELIVATTRPETMLGDTAVAVHPDDERYKHLIGKQIRLPLTGRLIPIIGDAYVDPAFGTGCVKITPAHDFNDYEVGNRHNLPRINILTAEAKINSNAPAQYQGLDRFAARKQIVADLEQQGLLAKTEPHTATIPRGDITKAIIEPYLTDQWFVKIAPLAEPAIAAVEQGKIKFVPENWSKTYFEWMNNIQDWCISRQLWWGHRIPAWYDANGKVYVGKDEAEIRAEHKLGAEIVLTQDQDVLDTWFSSALWPFSTLGWPEQTEKLKTFYPTNVLVTGFDIIFFWVARMIMFGLKFTDQIPFSTVYIHGLIQDQYGQKMSKSKGNILDPIDIIDGIDLDKLIVKRTTGLMQPQMAQSIEETTRKEFPNGIASFGTDALRFTFYSLATTGRHIRFDISKVENYRNFCNKLWNASRYVLMNTEGHASDLAVGVKTFTLADKWIMSRWQQVKANVIDHIEKYRLDLVAQDLYEFIWNEYCDWYLELSKPVLYGKDVTDGDLRGTRYTLLTMLDEILRVAHPFIPFITEEIWQLVAPILPREQTVTGNETSVAPTTVKIQPCPALIKHTYPLPQAEHINPEVENIIAWAKTFILGVRNIRGEMNISPSKQLRVLLVNASASDKDLISKYSAFIQSLAKLESITLLNANDPQPPAATALVGEMQILIPLQGLIDVAAETARLEREIAKLQKELVKAQVKLDNPSYVSKAPAAVVEKERTLVAELQSAISKLEQSLQSIGDL